MRVLISGGSRGIGSACVRRFVQGGWDTTFLYHASRDAAEALQYETGAAALQVDVADSAAVHAALQEPFDALVCCAGLAHWGLFQDMTNTQWDRLFAVNVGGVRNCVNAVLPGMLHRQQGSIVTVSSIWGQAGAACEAAYSATKGAVIALTRALAQELGPSGIRVNCISPGVIETDMTAGLDLPARAALCEQTPLGRLGTPEEVAEAIFFLTGEQASFITGQVLGVNGGFL